MMLFSICSFFGLMSLCCPKERIAPQGDPLRFLDVKLPCLNSPGLFRPFFYPGATGSFIGRRPLGDDLVGLLAGELLETVKLPLEGADAQSHRAQLDNQVVHFGLW
ncbi:MAG: hypothetical protein CFH05_00381 [Alphaproteobacteria bacterium MarineAlpha3_Bin4]|nr:MAG: hypothetical protein CFH05_00381 [Alphaproteobacteria bacterium MarineAlpha3_Bin4]